MAGQNDFLIFDENNENILTQANYASDTDRANGFRTGLARSIVTNKVLHQTSMVCHALGELAKDNDQVATDTGSVAELKTALKNALSGANVDLSNLSSTGQAKFNAKVSKSGDTMSGTLSISKAGYDQLKLINTNINTGVLPASDIHESVVFCNKNGTQIGDCTLRYKADGSIETYIQASKNNVNAVIGAGVDANNNPYSWFPNTTCCDGQWVNSAGQLASGVSLAIGNDQEIEYDISSYLPNDNYSYEVRFSIEGQTGSGSGAGLCMNIIGKAYNNVDTWTRICDIYARGSWVMVMANHAIVPVNSNRKIRLHYSVVSKTATLIGLHMEAYRRIGTNL